MSTEHEPLYRAHGKFYVSFDEDGKPSGHVERGELEDARVLWWNPQKHEYLLGPSDCSAIILGAGGHGRHIGYALNKWQLAFCKENLIEVTPETRHLPARKPLPQVQGVGFISGIFVRDVS